MLGIHVSKILALENANRRFVILSLYLPVFHASLVGSLRAMGRNIKQNKTVLFLNPFFFFLNPEYHIEIYVHTCGDILDERSERF